VARPAANRPPKLFEAVSSRARDSLGMKDDQRKKLDEIDKELIPKLEKVLTGEQIKILAEPIDDAIWSTVPAGEYLLTFKRNKLKLTDAQTKTLQALQKDFDPRIGKILTDEQKRSMEDFKKGQ